MYLQTFIPKTTYLFSRVKEDQKSTTNIQPTLKFCCLVLKMSKGLVNCLMARTVLFMIGFDGLKTGRDIYRATIPMTRDLVSMIVENGRGMVSNVVSRKQKVRKTYSNINQHEGKVLITRERKGFRRAVDTWKEMVGRFVSLLSSEALCLCHDNRPRFYDPSLSKKSRQTVLRARNLNVGTHSS